MCNVAWLHIHNHFGCFMWVAFPVKGLGWHYGIDIRYLYIYSIRHLAQLVPSLSLLIAKEDLIRDPSIR